MAEEAEMSDWRKKFLANRMSIESILFEREVSMPGREKLSTGILVLLGIWGLHVLLLANWVMKRGYFFMQRDAESFSAVLRYNSYLSANGLWALIRPELTGLDLNPPFYHLAYVPVLKFLTQDLNLALLAVNSFFLLVIALSVFMAVKKSRPNRAGWLGAAVALGLPFVMETARRPAPEMALMAMVAATYACYILADEFDNAKWTFWFGICLGLGFFSHRFFWLYALPLAPFLLNGFTGSISREELFKGVFPGLLINLPWYLFSAVVVFSGAVPIMGEYQGLLAPLRGGAVSAGLPMFTLGCLALFWMHFSVYMPYERRKIVSALFWVPYLVLAWGLRGRPELLQPAMLSFAIAIPVMTPAQFRKYIMAFVLVLAAVSQSGKLAPVFYGAYPLCGLPLQPAAEHRTGDLLDALKAQFPSGGLAGVYGHDAGLNSESLNFTAGKLGFAMKFADEPLCPACATALLCKTKPGTANTGAKAFSRLRAEPWFASLFQKHAELALPDSSKIEIFTKVRGLPKPFPEGSYELKAFSLGELRMESATLKVEGYDPLSGRYAKGRFFAPSATLFDGDVYGLELSLQGVELAGSGNPVLAGLTGGKLISAKVSTYSLERFLASRFPALEDVRVSLEGTLSVTGTLRGEKLDAELFPASTSPGVLELRPDSFKLGPVNVPGPIANLFSFRFNLSDNPYGIKVSGFQLRNQMVEFR